MIPVLTASCRVEETVIKHRTVKLFKIVVKCSKEKRSVLWWLRWRGPRTASLRKRHLNCEDKSVRWLFGKEFPKWSYCMFRGQGVGRRFGAWTREGQCDYVVAPYLDIRGSHRTTEGSHRKLGVGGLSEFASWPNEGFHSLCCSTGLLILVEPKATLRVEVRGMADVAIKEPLTSWWPSGDIGSLGVGAPLVRVSGELQPCSDECAFLGRFFGPGASLAFGKGVLWERVIVWWLGLGQKRSTWLILPPLGLLVGYLSSLSMC